MNDEILIQLLDEMRKHNEIAEAAAQQRHIEFMTQFKLLIKILNVR